MEERMITKEEALTIKGVFERLGFNMLLNGEICDAEMFLLCGKFFTPQPSVVGFLAEVEILLASSKDGKGKKLKKDIQCFIKSLERVNTILYAVGRNEAPLLQVDNFLNTLHDALEDMEKEQTV